ncbi:MAG: hypothetical protein MJ200_05995 [Mycoplasmoidaceae bacterium]|nr:hypothetical protein [Mycoplasmoidaceae bacterium]
MRQLEQDLVDGINNFFQTMGNAFKSTDPEVNSFLLGRVYGSVGQDGASTVLNSLKVAMKSIAKGSLVGSGNR